MKPITLIKLGGSVITDKQKPMTPRPIVIDAIADAIAIYAHTHPEVQLILGNGAGSYGHYLVQKYDLKRGMKTAEEIVGYCAVQDAVADLNRLVVKALLKKGLPVCSVQPSAIFTATNGTSDGKCAGAISQLVEKGIIPVVYGDIIVDKTVGCTIFSTEDIFDILINEELPITNVIHLTQVTGVLDQDEVVIPEITEENWLEVQKNIFSPAGFDVTGGMKHKIETALEYAKKGVTTEIISGEAPDIFSQAGTTITAAPLES